MTAFTSRLSASPVGDAVFNAGEMVQFAMRVLRSIFTLRVFAFSGELIRQAGIVIVSSGLVITSMIFVVGLQCGIEGGFQTAAVGAPAYAALFTAWCDLRELVPYVFGWMMAAKVGTGIVAELGAMRISEEIDALEVMGVDSLTFLCSTKLLAAWIVLPFLYMTGVAAGFFGSYIAVVEQLGQVSSGGYLQLFWQFQNPPDLLFSLTKAMTMATLIILVGCYYGYNTSGGPVGVGTATAKSMAVNLVLVHLVGMVFTQIFWGSNPRAPIGG
jgi:phospholipid/cholesterol/gamma-HCH transport system permease protein